MSSAGDISTIPKLNDEISEKFPVDFIVANSELRSCDHESAADEDTSRSNFDDCEMDHDNVEILSAEANWNTSGLDFSQATWTTLESTESGPEGYSGSNPAAEWSLTDSNRMSGLSDSIMSREVSMNLDQTSTDDGDQFPPEDSCGKKAKADLSLAEIGSDDTQKPNEPNEPSQPRNRCKRKLDDTSVGNETREKEISKKSPTGAQSEDLQLEEEYYVRPVTRSCVQASCQSKVSSTTSSSGCSKVLRSTPQSIPNKKSSKEARNKADSEKSSKKAQKDDVPDTPRDGVANFSKVAARSSTTTVAKVHHIPKDVQGADKYRTALRNSSNKNSDALEVLFDGDWWEAFQVAERQDGLICIRYVGGNSSEDEWLPRNSARVRQSQDPKRLRRTDRYTASQSACGRDEIGPQSSESFDSTPPPARGAGSSSDQIPSGGIGDGRHNTRKTQALPAMKAGKLPLTPEVSSDIIRKEEEIKRAFRGKGLDLRLNERVSVVNKKVDIHLKNPQKFSRTLLLQNLTEGKNNLSSHMVEVLQIRSNGQDAKRPDSAIFGRPVTLHMMVKAKNRRGGGSADAAPSKVVIRFYKETLQSDGPCQYLIQFNAGGQWTHDHNIACLIVDIFEPFGVVFKDVHVRTESSLYSVSNTNTFPGHRINIPMLIQKLKKAGHPGAKLLGATGGVSMEFTNPQCKPQIQVTGTIYVPFCGEPRKARLTVLQLLLQHSDSIQRVPD